MANRAGERRLKGVVARMLRVATLGAVLVLPTGTAGLAEDVQPIRLPVIKQEYPGKPRNIHTVSVRLMSVGDREVSQPLLLDTGSAGLSVDCDVVLPKDMCSPEGIRIVHQTLIDGISVSPEKLVAHYGGNDEYGNLARAVIRLGDKDASVVTEQPIAFMIRYKVVRRSDGKVVGGPLWPKGLIGISPLGAIDEAGSVISPLAAVAVPDGLHRGYSLGDLGTGWTVCTHEAGDCPSVPALAVGVDPADRKGWKFTRITRADPRYNFPTLAACLSVGDATPNCKPTLFDSGNSQVMVAGASGQPVKKGVKVTALTLGRWDFETTYAPEVAFVADLPHHIVGLRFFEENRLAVDLELGQIGLAIR